ncbi:hypothetical protein EJ357_41315 [Streptomyces cyaneochromogenes]|uniref:Uncharacterized protein n=1 Tax=Streptomyces cyaneochromogenes TaxID=2496836 RepID=A0A3S9MIU4_9ACTN|nr:hypothetical protein [Streptomyces cyaneochromogenes]AZQ39084.1 hypothetical protein EJ357_41315 [Streptomyces cyaneochromogenes]
MRLTDVEQVQVNVSGAGNVTAGRDIFLHGDIYTVESAEKALSKADKSDIVEAVVAGVRNGYIAPAVATQIAGGAPARRRVGGGALIWPSMIVTFMLVAALSQVNVDWLQTKNYLITGGLIWLAWVSVKRGWW